ncbi:replicative DNA helicase [Candidatus Saccharibacteria bacterium RIFCSPHIGHO2_12_FULL_41_12]|nr:MAG: replicative DNA helicase [Candidatus Saccharibacteria bacterium RIFCSPHIGHO2_12_FULL_41_12]
MDDKGKELPQNLEAEASLLGAILIDTDAIIKVADVIDETDFFDPKNAHIYRCIKKIYENRGAIDVLTLADMLKSENLLDSVGGSSYINELTNFVPTAAHVVKYAEIVSDKSMRRKLIRTSKEITDFGYNEQTSIGDIIETAETKLFDVSGKHVKNSIISLEQILNDSFERLDELHKDKGGVRGLSTGFKDLDTVLAGFQKSDLVIIAARPSMGKTALSLNLAHNVAKKTKERVLIFSLEMSKEQLVDRLLAAEAGVDAWNIRTGNMSDQDFEKIGHAMGTLSEEPILIDDTPSISVSEMRTKARREMHNHPIGLIIVDYLQLMSGSSKFANNPSNRVQEISEISRGLKNIARELNVPVIALSQLSRMVENRSPQIPQLADLRESGSIEQDADVVAFIYREEFYKPDTERRHIADILIKKHRNGPTGNIELYFDITKQRFRSLDSKHTTPFDQ